MFLTKKDQIAPLKGAVAALFFIIVRLNWHQMQCKLAFFCNTAEISANTVPEGAGTKLLSL